MVRRRVLWVETDGVKDHAKIRAFVHGAKAALAA